jgi:hypothetical protein
MRETTNVSNSGSSGPIDLRGRSGQRESQTCRLSVLRRGSTYLFDMADLDSYRRTVQAATDSVVKSLLQARHWEDCSFINLPISYPGGGDVTIKVTLNRSGFRVSDNGFAFREAEAYGLNEEKFSYVLSKIVAGTDLNKSQRTIYLDTDFSTLYGAICEVASASWRAAERIASNNEDDDEDDAS